MRSILVFGLLFGIFVLSVYSEKSAEDSSKNELPTVKSQPAATGSEKKSGKTTELNVTPDKTAKKPASISAATPAKP
ncbi:unnamed protein product [Chironomus riparius]|uniref:Uncharacterized protein n=1 Tax=Chironomus riparius TaxID=315576 RepID=A0A9N9WKH2_9DIPT|nr:unnamed protein product [Chironomus riparius]